MFIACRAIGRRWHGVEETSASGWSEDYSKEEFRGMPLLQLHMSLPILDVLSSAPRSVVCWNLDYSQHPPIYDLQLSQHQAFSP